MARKRRKQQAKKGRTSEADVELPKSTGRAKRWLMPDGSVLYAHPRRKKQGECRGKNQYEEGAVSVRNTKKEEHEAYVVYVVSTVSISVRAADGAQAANKGANIVKNALSVKDSVGDVYIPKVAVFSQGDDLEQRMYIAKHQAAMEAQIAEENKGVEDHLNNED